MAQTMTKKLDSGDAFPDMELRFLDEQTLTIPGDIRGSWTILLVYRGHW